MRAKKNSLWHSIQEHLVHLPKHILHYITGKIDSLQTSQVLAEHPTSLSLSEGAVGQMKVILSTQLKQQSKHLPAPSATAQEIKLMEEIRLETARANLNNCTRTESYLTIYRLYPELHWALLAHMVSRNGGWNMTDLRGELLPRIMSPQRAKSIFQFLETANSYIFQDAYPQLRLYVESRKQKRSLFHLLPSFNISHFMLPFWEQFLQTQDSSLLTIALIVNEQHYIEERVIQNNYFMKHVLDTVIFQTQALMQLNQVVFPYHTEVLTQAQQSYPYRLTGLVIEDFSSIHERIEVGKRLYAMLFGYEDVLQGVQQFALHKKHTGSRVDYWPQLFANIRKAPPSTSYTEKLDGCQLISSAAPLYSPTLSQAWPNITIEPPEPKDWFQNMEVMRYFHNLHRPHSFDMTNEFCFGLNKTELAVLAGEHLLDE